MSRPRKKRMSPHSAAHHHCNAGTDTDGLTKKTVDQYTGFGLFATNAYSKGNFIAEYRGVYCTEEDADASESDSTFQYFFSFKGMTKCIDANNVECLAKYANDDRNGGNSAMKVLEFNGQPHLCLFASTDISISEEIRYDYGVDSLPWRIPQNKEWPHRLMESDAVSACCECNSAVSPIKGYRLACFDCSSVWDEACFTKLSVKERCCTRSAIDIDTEITEVPGTSDELTELPAPGVGIHQSTSPGLPSPNEKQTSDGGRTKCPVPESDINYNLFEPLATAGSTTRTSAKSTTILHSRVEEPQERTMDGKQSISSSPASAIQDGVSDDERTAALDRAAMLTLLAISQGHSSSPPTSPCSIPGSSDACMMEQSHDLHNEDFAANSMEVCRSSDSETEFHDGRDDEYVPSSGESEDSETESEVFPIAADYKISLPSCNESAADPQDDDPPLPPSSSHVTEGQPSHVEECVPAHPYRKPYRLCPFCDSPKSKLSQHIALQHKDIECVANALALPHAERVATLASFKREGILKVNRQEAKSDQPTYQRERSTNKDSTLVMCSHCQGFYAKSYIKRHTVICQGEACQPSASIPVDLFRCEEDHGGEFVTEILSKFRNDDVGRICTSDPVLLKIGRRLWQKQKGKTEKKTEVRRSVMTDMRRLGSLYMELTKQEEVRGQLPVREGNVSDIFHRVNFAHLEDAIVDYTSKDDELAGIKAGLKMAVYYLLKSCSKILKATYLIEERDEAAENIDKFVAVLELNHSYLFGDAVYKSEQRRQINLRRPESLPLEQDIKTLRLSNIQKMLEISRTETADLHMFTQLRDHVVCRLTLFNARRGGEPSRLLKREWEDAEKGSWLDVNRMESLDPLDKAIAASLRVAYQSGKGNRHLVPVLFPKDTLEPIRKLISEEWRTAASINKQNPYLFPSSNASENHVSGWYAVNQCCGNLELKEKSLITATKNRHRVSTLFALMDVPEADRQFIYKHFGHSEDTNKNIYQSPLAIKELTVVGRRLQTIDETPVTAVTDSVATDDVPSTSSSTAIPGVSPAASQQIQGPAASDSTTAPNSAGMIPTASLRPAVDQPVDIPSNDSEEHMSTDQLREDQVSTSFDVTRGRKYSKWTKKDADIVKKYFKPYYDGTAQTKLPGRKEVMKFMGEHPTFPHNWKTVHSKIMNDLRLRQQRAKKREMDWQ